MKKVLLGKHLVLELSGCDPETLNNLPKILKILEDAALIAGAKVVCPFGHAFPGQGVTAGLVLAESALVVHSWPELGYLAVDFFTCGDSADPELAVEFLAESFGSKYYESKLLGRGPSVEEPDT